MNMKKKRFYQRAWFWVLACLLLAFLITTVVALVRSSWDTSPIRENEITALYEDPDSYKHRVYNFTGKVCSVSQKSTHSVLQIYCDAENHGRHTLVITDKKVQDLKPGDYVMGAGIVRGKGEPVNVMGKKIYSLKVTDAIVKEISPTEAVPTQLTILVDQENEQNGITVVLQKADFTKEQTHAYLTLQNQTSGPITFYSTDAEIVEDGKRYPALNERNSQVFQSVSLEVEPGETQPIVLQFPRIGDKNFTLSVECSDANLKTNVFTFNVDYHT